MAFEELYLALVLFRVLSGLESAEVTAPARLGISFSRIEPVFTRFQFSNHFSVLPFKPSFFSGSSLKAEFFAFSNSARREALSPLPARLIK